MKIFLETNSIDEIEKALDYKLIDGVNFNFDFTVFKEMNWSKDRSVPFKLVHGPVIVKTSEFNSQGILDEARQVIGLGLNSVINIPTTMEGLKAGNTLVENNISVCMFSKFTPIQVVMAGRLGGEFVNLELPDNDQEGDLDELVSIYKKYNFEPSIILSGFTKIGQIHEAVKAGVDIISIPYEFLIRLV